MLAALSCRVYMTHDRGYYESFFRTAHPELEHSAWVACNCPICHAEDVVATKVDIFEYHPFITTLLCEFGIEPVASANRIAIAPTHRGPPCLS